MRLNNNADLPDNLASSPLLYQPYVYPTHADTHRATSSHIPNRIPHMCTYVPHSHETAPSGSARKSPEQPSLLTLKSIPQAISDNSQFPISQSLDLEPVFTEEKVCLILYRPQRLFKIKQTSV